MITSEIIKALRGLCEDCNRPLYEKSVLTEAADKLFQLQQLIDDQANDHYVDTLENGKYHDWKWSCKDFNFGECPMLEATPCNGCIEEENRGFEWRGN